jgi:uncharacterized phage protein (TIGR02220 family)
MAEGKKSFLAYCDWRDTFESLPDEKAGQLIKHLFAYVNDEDPQTEDVLINAVFAAIKNTLKRDLDAWEESKGNKSDNGKLGNLKRWNLDLYDQVKNEKITLEEAEQIAKDRKGSPSDISESQTSQDVANIAVSDSVSVSVSDSVILNNNTGAFDSFIDWFNIQMKTVKGTKGQFKKLKAVKSKFELRVKEGYKPEDFKKAFENIVSDQYHRDNKYKYLTPEFLTRSDKLEKYCNVDNAVKTETPRKNASLTMEQVRKLQMS